MKNQSHIFRQTLSALLEIMTRSHFFSLFTLFLHMCYRLSELPSPGHSNPPTGRGRVDHMRARFSLLYEQSHSPQSKSWLHILQLLHQVSFAWKRVTVHLLCKYTNTKPSPVSLGISPHQDTAALSPFRWGMNVVIVDQAPEALPGQGMESALAPGSHQASGAPASSVPSTKTTHANS